MIRRAAATGWDCLVQAALGLAIVAAVITHWTTETRHDRALPAPVDDEPDEAM